jgi:hypothetical protein
MDLITDEQRKNLLEEYRTLHDSIYRRGATMQTVNSILLPSSILIIGLAIEYRESINSLFPIGIHASGFLPLFSALLLSITFFFTWTAGKINHICFNRIHEIEKVLEIKGHRYVFSQIKNSWWWKLRKSVWWILLPLAMVLCFITSGYLFL